MKDVLTREVGRAAWYDSSPKHGQNRARAPLESVTSRLRSATRARCCFPRRATPSSTSCATTWRSPTARCAPRAAGRTCSSAIPTASTASSSTRSARPQSRPPMDRGRALKFPSGRTAEEVVPRDAAALAWMANLACLELHPHPVRADDLDHPDELRIDLDPVPGVDVAAGPRGGRGRARDARAISGWSAGRRRRARAACTSTCASSARWTFDEVRRAALALAREVERRAPALATSKWWKEERHGVFLDYNQNAKDRTVAAAYSVRPKPDARVSAPLTWDEIADCDPADFTLGTMPARFAAVGRSARGDRRARRARSTRCSSCRRGTSGRAWATRRGRRTTRSSRASRRACSRRGGACRKHPLIEIARRAEEGRRAGRPRAMEGAPPGGGGASRAGRRARRRMRGRFHTWTRSASTCSTCPKRCGRLQEPLDPNDDARARRVGQRGRWRPAPKTFSSS